MCIRKFGAKVHVGDVGGAIACTRCRQNRILLAFDGFHGCTMGCSITKVIKKVATRSNTSRPQFIFFNGPILVLAKIIKNVMVSALEAEIGALFMNAQQAVPI